MVNTEINNRQCDTVNIVDLQDFSGEGAAGEDVADENEPLLDRDDDGRGVENGEHELPLYSNEKLDTSAATNGSNTLTDSTIGSPMWLDRSGSKEVTPSRAPECQVIFYSGWR